MLYASQDKDEEPAVPAGEMGSTMSNITFHKSSYGPIFVVEDRMFTVHDHPEMVRAFDEIPNFVDLVEKHLIETINEVVAEAFEALTDGYQYPTQVVFGYFNAFQVFSGFKHGFLPGYMKQIAHSNHN